MQSILKISCGLDVHKDLIEGCILIENGSPDPTIIRESFTTLRGDIIRLRDWLLSLGCLNVAMESTGVYWKPIYEILEDVEGIYLCLVNAHHMRNIPGRKTDANDAEWIATLFMFGLLNPSFVPSREVRTLREYTRLYVKLNQERVRHVNRLEKFLQTHGFKLSSVLSSIVGVSSRRILEKLCTQGYATVADVRAIIDKNVKSTADEIAYAINGNLSLPERTLLRMSLDTIYWHEKQLKDIFNAIQAVSEPFSSSIELLVPIPGIDILSAIYVLAEIGDDMSAFKSEAHIASWAGLCPRNDESAGKIKSKKILKGNHYIKSILCQCAWAAIKVRNTRLSNWYWRNVKRLGEKKAIIAVARKLLGYIYHILSTKTQYNPLLDIADTEKNNALKLESAKQRLSKMNDADCVTSNVNRNSEAVKKSIRKSSQSIKKNSEEQKSPSLNSDTIFPTAPKKRGRPKKIPQ